MTFKLAIKTIAKRHGQMCIRDRYTDKAVIRMYALGEHEPTIEADDMFFSIKQARNGGITEQLIGSLISATEVEDGDIAFGDNEINYLKVKNFEDVYKRQLQL